MHFDNSVRQQINVVYSTEGSVCGEHDIPALCNSSSTLQILNTRAVDSGEYTCVAVNTIKGDTASAQLTVNGRCCDSDVQYLTLAIGIMV